jgi:hypothetical protein
MSPDWANKPEPVPYAKLDHPQSLNLYAFAQNNPESAPDLDGHKTPLGTLLGGSDGPNEGLQNLESDQSKMMVDTVEQEQKRKAQQQSGDPTLPTAVQEPAPSLLDQALKPSVSTALMVATDGLGELAELGKALSGAAEAGEGLSKAGTIEKLTADAKELYPKLAEKADQLLHVIPKYLGGAQDGALAKIPAAYHQMITNAFRTLAPYGQSISRTTEEVTNIVKQVYSMFPLR